LAAAAERAGGVIELAPQIGVSRYSTSMAATVRLMRKYCALQSRSGPSGPWSKIRHSRFALWSISRLKHYRPR
jgi:hypothetical protein